MSFTLCIWWVSLCKTRTEIIRSYCVIFYNQIQCKYETNGNNTNNQKVDKIYIYIFFVKCQNKNSTFSWNSETSTSEILENHHNYMSGSVYIPVPRCHS